jgi:hypothetical protein
MDERSCQKPTKVQDQVHAPIIRVVIPVPNPPSQNNQQTKIHHRFTDKTQPALTQSTLNLTKRNFPWQPSSPLTRRQVADVKMWNTKSCQCYIGINPYVSKRQKNAIKDTDITLQLLITIHNHITTLSTHELWLTIIKIILAIIIIIVTDNNLITANISITALYYHS